MTEQLVAIKTFFGGSKRYRERKGYPFYYRGRQYCLVKNDDWRAWCLFKGKVQHGWYLHDYRTGFNCSSFANCSLETAQALCRSSIDLMDFTPGGHMFDRLLDLHKVNKPTTEEDIAAWRLARLLA